MAERHPIASPIPVAADKASSPKALALRVLPFALFLVVAIIAIAPFFSRTERAPGTGEPTGVLWTDDMPNHLAYSKEFDKVLGSGVIYPRWLAGVNNGYGIAMMMYYPPGFHYIASLAHLLVGDWINAFFLIAVLALAASAAAFYWFARHFFDRRASTIAALFYMLFPFHLFNFYWQGAMPQFLGYIFMPLVLAMAYRLGLRGRWQDYGLLGLVYGLYLLTHLPVSYLFTYALALYAVLWAVRASDFKIALRIACGMALGLLLSGIYWLPAALESKYIYEWASEVMPYHGTYLMGLESKDVFGFLVVFSFIALIAALTLASWALRARELDGDAFDARKKYAADSVYTQVRLWQMVGAAALFMSTSFSVYISRLIPRIQVATPAWRWLAVATLFISLLAGAAAERLLKRAASSRLRLWGYRAALGALMLISFWVTARYAIAEPVRTRTLYYFPPGHMDSGFTPKDATPITQLPDTANVVLTPQEGRSEILRWDPQHREIAAEVAAPSLLRLKTYNFPGWVAHVDGQDTKITTDKDGAQLIALAPGRHRIETAFVNTPPRTLGTVLTSLGLLAIFGLLVAGSLRQARQTRSMQDTSDSFMDIDALLVSEDAPALDASPIRKKQYQIHLARKPLIMALALLIVLAAAVIGFRTFFSSKQKTVNPLTSGSSGAQAGGSGTRLSLEAREFVPVAVDEKALDELLDALGRQDKDKLDALVAAKRVIEIRNQTGVRVLASKLGKANVEITEGEQVLQQGWVLERWIK